MGPHYFHPINILLWSGVNPLSYGLDGYNIKLSVVDVVCMCFVRARTREASEGGEAAEDGGSPPAEKAAADAHKYTLPPSQCTHRRRRAQ